MRYLKAPADHAAQHPGCSGPKLRRRTRCADAPPPVVRPRRVSTVRMISVGVVQRAASSRLCSTISIQTGPTPSTLREHSFGALISKPYLSAENGNEMVRW